MNVGDIRRAIEGVPDNTFVNISTISKPPEVTSVFPLGITFEPLPSGGPHFTTSEGQKVVGSVSIDVEICDDTFGHARHRIWMKHVKKARKKAKKELRKKGLK